jgi:hypothetical protein
VGLILRLYAGIMHLSIDTVSIQAYFVKHSQAKGFARFPGERVGEYYEEDIEHFLDVHTGLYVANHRQR